MPIAIRSKRKERYLRLERNLCVCGRLKAKSANICWNCYSENKIGWSKGLTKETDERLLKTSEAHLNGGNPQWKGDAAGYDALHGWIRRRKLKPALCVRCGMEPPYDLANISGEYKRDIYDYEWLCRKCHMIKDGRLGELGNYKKKNINIELLRYKRVIEKKSQQKIADELNVSRTVIRDALRGLDS